MKKIQLKLLHVEDDDGDAKIVQRALTKEFTKTPCELVRVTSLVEAIHKLQEHTFDAVLLDLNLTDVQGLNSVKRIKEQNPDLPIVVLSGHDDIDLALDTVRYGAQEYMVKGSGDGKVMGLAVLSSIERKAHERLLFKQANHDELTGLPNRRMFFEYMHRTLLRAGRWKRKEGIVFMDVNGFKKVNDTFGHETGDMLLRQIATRLKTGLRACDMVARYAGDEFVAHLDSEGGISHEACTRVAEKIADLFRDPIAVSGHEIKTSISIGIALYPDHGKDTEELIQNADKAMYEAKKQGKDFCFV
jgi:diguanylate cyclase (GGDEF)-like protein